MRLRDLALNLDETPGKSPSRRLADALIQAISEGRLAPGVGLPGSRALAEMLNLNRNTVIAALRDLEAEGWLVMEPNRGTFISQNLPDFAVTASRPTRPKTVPNFDLPSRLSPLSAQNEGALWLADGLPDAGLFPTGELAKAYQRALQRHSAELLQPGEPLGNHLLRNTLVEWLRERRGLALSPDELLITRGTRMAAAIIGRGLLREGEAVAVEDPGHRVTWEALQQGPIVDLIPIPVDQDGLVVEALETQLQQRSIRALYLRPQHQHPTTVTLSPRRRDKILALATAARMVLIEEDSDSEYFYGDAPPMPLAAQDQSGQVIYIGSLSRIVAPGLRLGFIAAPAELIRRLARVQRSLEWQGDRVLEWALADLMRDGVLARHLRKTKKAYAARRDHLIKLLSPFQGSRFTFESPSGGLAVWLKALPEVDLESWVLSARNRGLVLHPPSRFSFAQASQGTRMGFSQLDEVGLEQAVDRLNLAWRG